MNSNRKPASDVTNYGSLRWIGFTLAQSKDISKTFIISELR